MRRIITQSGKLDLHDEPISYTLHRMAGRKHVHLVLGDNGELQVRAPWRYSRAEAEAVIRHYGAWVQETLREAQAYRRPPLVTGTRLPFIDDELRLDVRTAPANRVRREGDWLRVRTREPEVGGVRRQLERWYRNEARRLLAERLQPLAARLDVRPVRVSVRGQRSRWGSCSAQGTISLNWRLLLLPSDLIDYVLVHELCHLRHMDHSPRFWAMVARVIADVEGRRRRLQAVPPTMPL